MSDETLATPPTAPAPASVTYYEPPAHYATPSSVNPIAIHVKVIGICFCILAVLSLGFALMMMGTGAASGVASARQAKADPSSIVQGSRASEETPAQMVGVAVMLGAVFSTAFIVIGVITLIAGIGLLRRHSWGRIAAIIASVPLLISFPFGTALSIYTLIVMLKSDAKPNYALLTAKA